MSPLTGVVTVGVVSVGSTLPVTQDNVLFVSSQVKVIVFEVLVSTIHLKFGLGLSLVGDVEPALVPLTAFSAPET